MKIAAISGAVVAALAIGAVAAPSSAQPYGYSQRDACQHKKHSNAAVGTILGGVAGAVIGSNVSSGGGRTGGTIIGGVAGAAVGNSVGRSSAKSSDACEDYRSSYYRDSRDYGRSAYDSRSAYDHGYDTSYHDYNAPY